MHCRTAANFSYHISSVEPASHDYQPHPSLGIEDLSIYRRIRCHFLRLEFHCLRKTFSTFPPTSIQSVPIQYPRDVCVLKAKISHGKIENKRHSEWGRKEQRKKRREKYRRKLIVVALQRRFNSFFRITTLTACTERERERERFVFAASNEPQSPLIQYKQNRNNERTHRSKRKNLSQLFLCVYCGSGPKQKAFTHWNINYVCFVIGVVVVGLGGEANGKAARWQSKRRESEQEKWIKQLYDITRNKGTISIQVGGRSIYNSVESLDKTFSRLFVIANIREMSMLFLIRFRNAFLLLLLLPFFLLRSFGFAASVVGCSDSKKQKKNSCLVI